ncbi:MAG: ABC transporter permease [Dehalococcoidales bacterium]|nr:ABC transporter permease [Dehalococcoidales bacterium]
MRSYTTKRLALVIPTLFLASLVVFFLIRFIPGDVIDLMIAEQGPISDLNRGEIEQVLGLDLPVYTQYVHWLGGAIRGDLGTSLWSESSISDEILARLPVTFELGILALVIALIVALPVGIYSAMRQDTIGDYLGRSFAILSLAVPNFWIATMIIVFPSIWWGWSPPMTMVAFGEDPMTNLQMFIIPALVMGTSMSAVTVRMTRTMMLEVLRQDYIRTAWSKGLRERVVVMRHALKNAMIPVVTIVGLQVPILIGGAVIMEQIFSLPGIGRLMIDAISRRDYPVVSGVMIFMAIFVLFANLLVDLTYGYLDPRIKYK